MSLVGNSRNKPCRCGSGLKFKKCCLPMAQGFIKTGSGWVKPTHVHIPDIASDCDGCYQLARETLGKGDGNENSAT